MNPANGSSSDGSFFDQHRMDEISSTSGEHSNAAQHAAAGVPATPGGPLAGDSAYDLPSSSSHGYDQSRYVPQPVSSLHHQQAPYAPFDLQQYHNQQQQQAASAMYQQPFHPFDPASLQQYQQGASSSHHQAPFPPIQMQHHHQYQQQQAAPFPPIQSQQMQQQHQYQQQQAAPFPSFHQQQPQQQPPMFGHITLGPGTHRPAMMYNFGGDGPIVTDYNTSYQGATQYHPYTRAPHGLPVMVTHHAPQQQLQQQQPPPAQQPVAQQLQQQQAPSVMLQQQMQPPPLQQQQQLPPAAPPLQQLQQQQVQPAMLQQPQQQQFQPAMLQQQMQPPPAPPLQQLQQQQPQLGQQQPMQPPPVQLQQPALQQVQQQPPPVHQQQPQQQQQVQPLILQPPPPPPLSPSNGSEVETGVSSQGPHAPPPRNDMDSEMELSPEALRAMQERERARVPSPQSDDDSSVAIIENGVAVVRDHHPFVMPDEPDMDDGEAIAEVHKEGNDEEREPEDKKEEEAPKEEDDENEEKKDEEAGAHEENDEDIEAANEEEVAEEVENEVNEEEAVEEDTEEIEDIEALNEGLIEEEAEAINDEEIDPEEVIGEMTEAIEEEFAPGEEEIAPVELVEVAEEIEDIDDEENDPEEAIEEEAGAIDDEEINDEEIDPEEAIEEQAEEIEGEEEIAPEEGMEVAEGIEYIYEDEVDPEENIEEVGEEVNDEEIDPAEAIEEEAEENEDEEEIAPVELIEGTEEIYIYEEEEEPEEAIEEEAEEIGENVEEQAVEVNDEFEIEPEEVIEEEALEVNDEEIEPENVLEEVLAAKDSSAEEDRAEKNISPRTAARQKTLYDSPDTDEDEDKPPPQRRPFSLGTTPRRPVARTRTGTGYRRHRFSSSSSSDDKPKKRKVFKAKDKSPSPEPKPPMHEPSLDKIPLKSAMKKTPNVSPSDCPPPSSAHPDPDPVPPSGSHSIADRPPTPYPSFDGLDDDDDDFHHSPISPRSNMDDVDNASPISPIRSSTDDADQFIPAEEPADEVKGDKPQGPSGFEIPGTRIYRPAPPLFDEPATVPDPAEARKERTRLELRLEQEAQRLKDEKQRQEHEKMERIRVEQNEKKKARDRRRNEAAKMARRAREENTSEFISNLMPDLFARSQSPEEAGQRAPEKNPALSSIPLIQLSSSDSMTPPPAQATPAQSTPRPREKPSSSKRLHTPQHSPPPMRRSALDAHRSPTVPESPTKDSTPTHARKAVSPSKKSPWTELFMNTSPTKDQPQPSSALRRLLSAPPKSFALLSLEPQISHRQALLAEHARQSPLSSTPTHARKDGSPSKKSPSQGREMPHLRRLLDTPARELEKSPSKTPRMPSRQSPMTPQARKELERQRSTDSEIEVLEAPQQQPKPSKPFRLNTRPRAKLRSPQRYRPIPRLTENFRAPASTMGAPMPQPQTPQKDKDTLTKHQMPQQSTRASHIPAPQKDKNAPPNPQLQQQPIQSPPDSEIQVLDAPQPPAQRLLPQDPAPQPQTADAREPMLHEILSGIQETVEPILAPLPAPIPPPIDLADSDVLIMLPPPPVDESSVIEVIEPVQPPQEEAQEPVFAELLTPAELKKQQEQREKAQQPQPQPQDPQEPQEPPQEPQDPRPADPVEPVQPAVPARKARTQWRKMTAREKAEALQLDGFNDPKKRSLRVDFVRADGTPSLTLPEGEEMTLGDYVKNHKGVIGNIKFAQVMEELRLQKVQEEAASRKAASALPPATVQPPAATQLSPSRQPSPVDEAESEELELDSSPSPCPSSPTENVPRNRSPSPSSSEASEHPQDRSAFDLSAKYIRQHRTNLALPGAGKPEPLMKAPADFTLREEDPAKNRPAPKPKAKEPPADQSRLAFLLKKYPNFLGGPSAKEEKERLSLKRQVATKERLKEARIAREESQEAQENDAQPPRDPRKPTAKPINVDAPATDENVAAALAAIYSAAGHTPAQPIESVLSSQEIAALQPIEFIGEDGHQHFIVPRKKKQEVVYDPADIAFDKVPESSEVHQSNRALEFAIFEKIMNKKKRKRIYKLLNMSVPKGRPRSEEWVRLREKMWAFLKGLGMAQLDMDQIMKNMDEDGVIDERILELKLQNPSVVEEAERAPLSPITAWDIDNVDLDSSEDSEDEHRRRDSFPTMEQFEMQERAEAEAAPVISQRSSRDDEEDYYDPYERYEFSESEEELYYQSTSSVYSDEDNFVTIEDYEEQENAEESAASTRRPEEGKGDESNEEKMRRMEEGRWLKNIKSEVRRKDTQESTANADDELDDEVEAIMTVRAAAEPRVTTYARVEGLRIHQASLSPEPQPIRARRRRPIDDGFDKSLLTPEFNEKVNKICEDSRIDDPKKILEEYDEGTKNVVELLDVMMYSESESESEVELEDGGDEDGKVVEDADESGEGENAVEPEEEVEQEEKEEKVSKMGRPRIHPKEDEADVEKRKWRLEAHQALHPELYDSANAARRRKGRNRYPGGVGWLKGIDTYQTIRDDPARLDDFLVWPEEELQEWEEDKQRKRMDAKRAANDDDIMIIEDDFDDIEFIASIDGTTRPKVDYGDEVQIIGEVHPATATEQFNPRRRRPMTDSEKDEFMKKRDEASTSYDHNELMEAQQREEEEREIKLRRFLPIYGAELPKEKSGNPELDLDSIIANRYVPSGELTVPHHHITTRDEVYERVLKQTGSTLPVFMHEKMTAEKHLALLSSKSSALARLNMNILAVDWLIGFRDNHCRDIRKKLRKQKEKAGRLLRTELFKRLPILLQNVNTIEKAYIQDLLDTNKELYWMEVFSLVAGGLEHLYKRPMEEEAVQAREEILFLLGTCPFPQGATAAETAALLEKAKKDQLRAVKYRNETCRNRKAAQKHVDLIELEEREDGPSTRPAHMVEMAETADEGPSVSERCYPRRPISYLRDKTFGKTVQKRKDLTNPIKILLDVRPWPMEDARLNDGGPLKVNHFWNIPFSFGPHPKAIRRVDFGLAVRFLANIARKEDYYRNEHTHKFERFLSLDPISYFNKDLYGKGGLGYLVKREYEERQFAARQGYLESAYIGPVEMFELQTSRNKAVIKNWFVPRSSALTKDFVELEFNIVRFKQYRIEKNCYIHILVMTCSMQFYFKRGVVTASILFQEDLLLIGKMAAAPYRYIVGRRSKLEEAIDRDERVLVHMQRHAQERLAKIAELSQEHLPVDKALLLDNRSLEKMNGEQLTAVTESLVNKAIGFALLVIFKATTVVLFDPSHRMFDKPNPSLLKKVIDDNAISLEGLIHKIKTNLDNLLSIQADLDRRFTQRSMDIKKGISELDQFNDSPSTTVDAKLIFTCLSRLNNFEFEYDQRVDKPALSQAEENFVRWKTRNAIVDQRKIALFDRLPLNKKCVRKFRTEMSMRTVYAIHTQSERELDQLKWDMHMHMLEIRQTRQEIGKITKDHSNWPVIAVEPVLRVHHNPRSTLFTFSLRQRLFDQYTPITGREMSVQWELRRLVYVTQFERKTQRSKDAKKKEAVAAVSPKVPTPHKTPEARANADYADHSIAPAKPEETKAKTAEQVELARLMEQLRTLRSTIYLSPSETMERKKREWAAFRKGVTKWEGNAEEEMCECDEEEDTRADEPDTPLWNHTEVFRDHNEVDDVDSLETIPEVLQAVPQNLKHNVVTENLSLPRGAMIKETYVNEISGVPARVGMCKLPKLPLDGQIESSGVLIERWWLGLDVSSFVDFALEEEDVHERTEFSRTKMEMKSTEVAAVLPWGDAAMEDEEECDVIDLDNIEEVLARPHFSSPPPEVIETSPYVVKKPIADGASDELDKDILFDRLPPKEKITVNASSALYNSYYSLEEQSEEERKDQLLVEHNLYSHLANDFTRDDLLLPRDASHEEKIRMLQNYATAISRPTCLVKLIADPSTEQSPRKRVRFGDGMEPIDEEELEASGTQEGPSTSTDDWTHHGKSILRVKEAVPIDIKRKVPWQSSRRKIFVDEIAFDKGPDWRANFEKETDFQPLLHMRPSQEVTEEVSPATIIDIDKFWKPDGARFRAFTDRKLNMIKNRSSKGDDEQGGQGD